MVDEFQGESGLKEDWDGAITESRFEQQGRGNWALVLKSKADDGEEVEHRPLSVGGADKGWVSHDGGEEIMGPTEKSRFQERSTIQQFINRAMGTGAEEVLRKRSAENYNHRGPMYAGLWLGLRFHWDVMKEHQDRPQEVTLADGTVSREWISTEVTNMWPTKFLGVSGEQTLPLEPTQSSSSAAATSGSGSTTQPAGPVAAQDGISTEDLQIVKVLAVSHDDWGEFAEAVMAASDSQGNALVKNPAVRKSLAKRDWWSSLRS